MLTCPRSPPSTLTSALVVIPHAPGSPPTLQKPQGSLTLVLLGTASMTGSPGHSACQQLNGEQFLGLSLSLTTTLIVLGSFYTAPVCLGTRFVDQADLEFTGIHLPLPPRLESKVCATTPTSCFLNEVDSHWAFQVL